jgi:hypothetical protein
MGRAAIMLCGLLAGGGLVGCGAPDAMGGFSPREATARPLVPEIIEACKVRRGRLVLEVERAFVREYPRTKSDTIHEKKQPLLLLWVSIPERGPGATLLTPLAAPEEYQAGEVIRWFEGRRLLEIPARQLAGRRLDLRLAENNRTAEPEWRRIAGVVGRGVPAVGGELGAPMPPASLIDLALDQLRNLDKDDLLLRWSGTADEVMAALGEPSQTRALRLRLVSSRASTSEPGKPAAELDILFYWEPEPGCGWERPFAPAPEAPSRGGR